MMRSLILVALLFNTAHASAQDAALEKELLGVMGRYHDAVRRMDPEAIGGFETEDFVVINQNRVRDKANQVEYYRALQKLAKAANYVPPPIKLTFQIHKIVPAGENRFIVSGVGIDTLPVDGKPPLSQEMIFTEVWLRQGTQWRLQYAHFSPLPSPTKAAINPPAPKTIADIPQ
jgi:ketosteroid isomerase-like protein